jgi:polar amino acid transport system permease protein
VDYDFQFGQVVGYLPYLAAGAWISLQLAVLAFSGGMVIGLVGAACLTFGDRVSAGLVRGYVTFFTNTPQLVQIYFLYFALPSLGIVLSPFVCVLIAMTVNAGAYLTEIQRAGFLSVRRSELDAAETLGMSRVQTVWYVIAPHVVRTLYRALSSHFVHMTLGSSMAAIFGVEELSGRAMNVTATTFRAIEIFVMTGALYVVLTVIVSFLLAAVGRYGFRVRMRVFS